MYIETVQRPKVIAVVGPTASGKSSLGIFLAQKLGGEIISADSRQVYRGLDIGTGKVTKKEMAGIPHHLLSVASPKKVFTVDDFVKLGEIACSQILKNEKTPIIVGGTGLYIDALLGRVSIPSVPPNQKLRAQLEKKTPAQLLRMLQKLDPTRAETIEQKNPRRLVRAIEIAKAIGKTPPKKAEEKYEVLWIGINPPEKKLRKNIHARLLARMRAGMVREAKQLHKQGLSYKRMEAFGLEYRSLAQLLQKKQAEKEMISELERAIQKYAKRQMRWFKRNPDTHWIRNRTEALRLAKEFCGR